MNEAIHPEGAILNAALELPADARAAYLDKTCAGDPALRERVEALLQAHEQAAGFLEAPFAHVERNRGGTAARGPAEKAGDCIGPYKLLQQIGEGGCGVVYMAEQKTPILRRVALKVIKPGMDTKQVIARFEAERQALALMDHPNISKVLDARATESGRPYFVMELVRGVKITDFCDEQNLSTDERLRLFIQVCQAIQHAHQKGVIHRDVKPSNILVTINDGVPVPKVIDFGIAKATQGRLTDQTVFTAFEQFIGTPAYMSPEQAVLTSLDVDTRSDIYSLGVLLYELLTGSTPFDQKELLAAGMDEMRRTIGEKEPPKPSTRLSSMAADALTTTAKRRRTDAPKLIHLVRGDLDWIVMKCLEKDRNRRYETANGLASDIQRHINSEPVVARPPSRLYEFQKTLRRHKFGFAATGAVSLALLLGLGVSIWSLVKEREDRQRAVAAAHRAESGEQKAHVEAVKSRQVAQFLKDMLEGVSPSVAMGRDTTMLREILDMTSERVGKELTNQPEVEVDLRTTISEAYLALGQSEKAEATARTALESARRLGANQPVVGWAYVALSATLAVQRQLDEAERAAREALRIFRSQSDAEYEQKNRGMAQALYVLGFSLQLQGKSEPGLEAFSEFLKLVQNLPDGAPQEVIGLDRMAFTFAQMGRMSEAEVLFRQALRMIETNHACEPSLPLVLGHLGDACSEGGKLTEAENLFRRRLAVLKKWFGQQPGRFFTLNNLGQEENCGVEIALDDLRLVLGKEGKLEEAESVRREKLACLRQTVDALAKTGTPETPDLLRQRGNLLARMGRWKEAAADLTRLRDLHPSEHLVWHGLAALLVQNGDLPAYQEHCRMSLKRFGTATDFFTTERISKDCVILSSSGVDLAEVVGLREKAQIAGVVDKQGLAWLQFGNGLTDYRLGHYASAAERARRVLGVVGERPARDVGAEMVLAMAKWQLGQPEAARATLAKGLRDAATDLPSVESGDVGGSWIDWIITMALTREAKALIDGGTASNSASPSRTAD